MTNEPTTSGLTRRRLLRQAGALGIAAATTGSLAAERGLAAVETSGARLALTPEQEEGPFYVALEKIRKDITLGRPASPSISS